MVTIRTLIDQDIDAIAKLEQQLFGMEAWSKAAIEQEIHAPARYYLVATHQEEVVGYAGFWYDGEDAQLMTIGVSQNIQGQHVGSTLLQQLVDLARQLGAYRMLLEVRVDNDPALGLYRKFGFTTMGIRKRYYQPEGIDAYTMSVQLNDRRIGFQVE